METTAALALEWARFDNLDREIAAYLKTSETEFARLIQALDGCWQTAEEVVASSKAIGALIESATGSESAEIREAMAEGCEVFTGFLDFIRGVSQSLARLSQKTRGLLEASGERQEILTPLKHIAFHFRLEGSRLSAGENASLLKIAQEIHGVLTSMKEAGDSQERAMTAVEAELTASNRSVEKVSACFIGRISESGKAIERVFSVLSNVPEGVREFASHTTALGERLGVNLGEAVKVLQGQDAIRQRLENVLQAMGKLRERAPDAAEPAHIVRLQREQARHVLAMIRETRTGIERELNAVIDSARSIAAEGTGSPGGGTQMKDFIEAVDHMASLVFDVTGLLSGEYTFGAFVLMQVEPIGAILNTRSGEIEALARAMKRLALNVLVNAESTHDAKAINVLGNWTSEVAESVLALTTKLNGRYVALAEELQAQVAEIRAKVSLVESAHAAAEARWPEESQPAVAYEEFCRLGREAREIRRTTEELVRSLRFADEGRDLLERFDAICASLLTLYPKPTRPFDAEAEGYTMREQHQIHAAVFGGAEISGYERLGDGGGAEYGENVELF
jgi:hypothetical protein